MKHKKNLATVAIFISLGVIVIILFYKHFEQVKYANNTEVIKQELTEELPVCDNGKISSSVVDTDLNYEPDELMGSIYIPKFELTIPLYMENDSDETNWALELGVAMDDASSYPYGESATVVFGHRHYDFQVLKDINVGDEIVVSIGENIYLYEVSSVEVINETQVEEVFTDVNELVLYTCYPFYWGATTNERFVVHATPVDSISC